MFLTQISTCDLCQRNSQKLSISTPELFPVPVHSPWHHVGIDFVGPISPTLVPGLTTEDKKMITSGGWLSDEIVDAGQKLLKSMYPHIQGLQEVALGMVLSYSIAKSESFRS